MSRKPSYEELERRIQQMKAEQEQYRPILNSLIENAVVGFYQSTPEGRFIWVNTAFAKILGYDTPEQLMDNVSDIQNQFFMDGSDRDRFTDILVKKGCVENFECKIRCRNGGTVWVSENSRSQCDSNGKIIAYEGMIVDITERRQAEQAKKVSEKFIYSLLNALPVPVFYKDRAGRYQGFNTAFESFFGKKREEMVGKSVFDISPVALAQIYYDKDEELFDSGGPQRYESQVKNVHGSVRDVIFDKSVYKDKDGRAAGLIGTVLDITDRKKFERAVQESEARFRAIFDDANDGILVANSKTKKFVMANNVICRMLGYTRVELFGLSVLDIHPEEEVAEVVKTFEKQARQEIKIAENIPVKRKDGTLFYADINTSPIFIGDDMLLVGIFRDITQRRQMEDALKKSEERFREMADLLPGAVVETDADVNITYVNRMGLEMFGYRETDIAAGLNGLNLVCPEQREKAAGRLGERISQLSVLPTEYRMVTKDDQDLWVFLNASPILKAGKVAGFRIVLTDISDRKQIEKDRETLINDLQEALAEIKTLRGIVPICSNCKKIRDDQGYWNILENFIQEHSEASFSHSICPECSDQLYGNENWYQKMKKRKSDKSED